MLVRVRHAKGVLKLELESDEISSLKLYEKVASQLASEYPDVETFWLSGGDAQEPDSNKIIPEPSILLKLTHGQLFYLHLKKAELEPKNKPSIQDSSVDSKLKLLDGKIRRPRDDRLCRHGPTGMCDHCHPLEPYDKGYLEKQGIKHMSFYSWLRKLRASSNAAVPLASLLETPKYTVDTTCPYHAPFPQSICTKCQPSAIILRQQPFRMVDHVEIASPKLVDEFLAGWRATGFQRFGWLIGRYDTYTDQVPLGIKAVVEYIYEPPQDGSIDGFQLIETDYQHGIEPRHYALIKSMQLDIVGIIYTDLIDDGTGSGKVEHRRSKESFFVSSPEVLFIAHQQALHPFKLPDSSGKTFSSRFVSVVVSGEEDGGIGLKAYQVSESAVAMEEANMISATSDPSQMLVKTVDETDPDPHRPLYVPQVFYKFKNEYGIEVQKAADPLFPVDYLLITLSEGIPLQPDPLFKSPLAFPAPHLYPTSSNLVEYFKDCLSLGPNELAATGLLSDMNLLFFMSEHGLFANDSERNLLCEALLTFDTNSLSSFITGSETWNRVLAAVSEAVAHKLNANQESGGVSWECKHCTFFNEKSGNGEQTCEMCGLPNQ